MKELMQLVIALTLIAAVAGLCLALVYVVTEGPITVAERENTLKAVRTVLPPFDEADLSEVKFALPGEGEEHDFYIAGDGEGEIIGVAFPWKSREGYSGELEVMIGVVLAEGKYRINKIEILRHAETPGLGSKIEEEKFKGQFSDTNPDNRTFEVNKDDPGSPGKPPIDGITGATISSRAVTQAAINGLTYFTENSEAILTSEPIEGDE